MTLQDVENYIIRHNLNERTRKREISDPRMYLYAYLFHKLGLNFSEIGKIFGRNHAAIRSGVIAVFTTQHYDDFVEHTQELMDQLRFIVPEYKDRKVRTTERKEKLYTVNVKLTKTQFNKYMKKKDEKVILDLLFNAMVEQSRSLNKKKK